MIINPSCGDDMSEVVTGVLAPIIGLVVVMKVLGGRQPRLRRATCKHGVLKSPVKTKAGGTRRCKIRS